MYNDVLHVNYGMSKICSICGTLVTRGSHFYQTLQTSQAEVTDLASQNRTSREWFIKVLRSKSLRCLSHMQVL